MVLLATIIPAAVSAAGDGTVTMTTQPSMDGNFYVGDTITFSGTNTASGTTYLFITGFNYDSNGAQIDNNPWENPVVDGDVSTFVAVPVRQDHTWSWSWNTQDVAIWEKTYTVYAASAPRDVSHLGGAAYTTTAIPVRWTKITAGVFPQDAEQGEKITISGIARGGPASEVAIWVIGQDYSDRFVTRPDSQGFYSMDIDTATTGLDAGDYHIIAQHPGLDREYGIILNGEYVFNTRTHSSIFRFRGYDRLKGDMAYEALMDLFRVEAADTVAAPVTFHVRPNPSVPTVTATPGEGTITMTPSPATGGYYYAGDTITFAGTNTASDTTYLFITGFNYNGNGAQIDNNPWENPVIDSDASTFVAVPVGPDHAWSWSWDTQDVAIWEKPYTVYAASAPRDVSHLGGAAYTTNTIPMKWPAAWTEITPTPTATPTPTPTPAIPATLSLVPGTTAITHGSAVTFSVMAGSLPYGLSGYNVDISVENPQTAAVIRVETPQTKYPDSLTEIGAMPSGYVRVKKVYPLDPGTVNAELFNFTVEGNATGTTQITLVSARLDDRSGNRIPLTIVPAVLTVGEPVPPASVTTGPVPGITGTLVPAVTGTNPGPAPTASPAVTNANPGAATTAMPLINPDGSKDKTVEQQDQKIEEQNRILEAQKQLIDEQDRKIEEQQNILDRLMELIRKITGQQ